MLLIPAHGRLRQEDLLFEASQGYRMRSCVKETKYEVHYFVQLIHTNEKHGKNSKYTVSERAYRNGL